MATKREGAQSPGEICTARILNKGTNCHISHPRAYREIIEDLHKHIAELEAATGVKVSPAVENDILQNALSLIALYKTNATPKS